MFNTTNNSVSHHVNAVSGNIIKTYKDSFFERFHLQSTLATNLLSDLPKLNNKRVVIIQMTICGDMEVIAEIMYQSDYDKLFNVGSLE